MVGVLVGPRLRKYELYYIGPLEDGHLYSLHFWLQ